MRGLPKSVYTWMYGDAEQTKKWLIELPTPIWSRRSRVPRSPLQSKGWKIQHRATHPANPWRLFRISISLRRSANHPLGPRFRRKTDPQLSMSRYHNLKVQTEDAEAINELCCYIPEPLEAEDFCSDQANGNRRIKPIRYSGVNSRGKSKKVHLLHNFGYAPRDAITAFRNCLLCSDADRLLCGTASYVPVLVIISPVPYLEQPPPPSTLD
jgi:hypothetical protein